MAQDVKIIDVDSDGILTVVFPTGVERAKSSFNLIQRVAKRILTLEGSDIVNPTVGTNIPAMFTSLADSDKEHLSGVFPIYISDLEQELKLEQLIIPNLPKSEQLKSLVLLELKHLPESLSWHLKLRVDLQDGTSQLIVI
ncbi:hypothetical protein HN682_07665 [Candidatus Peregrinibacteria bacterium]|jgi:hypothetical protein|nr:hypothetical protein [Candidatus Peregrinibacteria bacterium]